MYLLQHVYHGVGSDSADATHRDEDDRVSYDEDFDDFKIIGIFDPLAAVEAAQKSAHGCPRVS